MYSTLLLSALVASVAGSPTPAIKRQSLGMEVEIKFGQGLVPMGMSLDTINGGFESANTVCDWRSCNPGAAVYMDVGVVLPLGAYNQADTGALTIKFDGRWDIQGEGDNHIRDTLITEMRQAATGVASKETITVQTKYGSTGKSCDINPAACKDPEYKDFDVYAVPDKIALVARKDGKIVAEMSADLSIVIPEMNLGPFNCGNAQTYADKVLSSVPGAVQFINGACTLVGLFIN